jgi:hypothetical protein
MYATVERAETPPSISTLPLYVFCGADGVVVCPVNISQ